MITSEQKARMRAVINIFENDSQSPKTDYSSIYIYPDGPGERRQLTLGFGITEYGQMQTLVRMYINDGGSRAESFQKFVGKIGKTPLVDDKEFRALLKDSAKNDPIFQAAEDKIFVDKYFAPAQKFFTDAGFTQPLSLMVVLDSYIHSGSIPGFLRSRFSATLPSAGGNEKEWIAQYINARHAWLANHSRAILRRTIYRTQFFKNQIAKQNWEFNTPMNANGVEVPS